MDQTQKPDIYTRLGMGSASQTDKQALGEQLVELTLERLMGKVEKILSPEDMAYLEGLIDANVPDMVEPALRQRVPNYDQVLAEAAQEVEDQLVRDQQAVLATARQRTANPA